MMHIRKFGLIIKKGKTKKKNGENKFLILNLAQQTMLMYHTIVNICILVLPKNRNAV